MKFTLKVLAGTALAAVGMARVSVEAPATDLVSNTMASKDAAAVQAPVFAKQAMPDVDNFDVASLEKQLSDPAMQGKIAEIQQAQALIEDLGNAVNGKDGMEGLMGAILEDGEIDEKEQKVLDAKLEQYPDLRAKVDALQAFQKEHPNVVESVFEAFASLYAGAQTEDLKEKFDSLTSKLAANPAFAEKTAKFLEDGKLDENERDILANDALANPEAAAEIEKIMEQDPELIERFIQEKEAAAVDQGIIKQEESDAVLAEGEELLQSVSVEVEKQKGLAEEMQVAAADGEIDDKEQTSIASKIETNPALIAQLERLNAFQTAHPGVIEKIVAQEAEVMSYAQIDELMNELVEAMRKNGHIIDDVKDVLQDGKVTTDEESLLSKAAEKDPRIAEIMTKLMEIDQAIPGAVDNFFKLKMEEAAAAQDVKQEPETAA
ncbi:Uncharacterized protein PBTT_07603 [Plasmodiophora brassicae]|uniref:Uncharacterized protein n=1 Tax=Plasmodiophora brassicae TaxID=37360 RepID=A0A0G4IM99_PLABS|nr:hypothetical protein PBRA_004950 [Plasmodiophora brassicae]SPQ99216.1 unnamed protein product [Plasmodiophora brassicae]